MFIIFVALALSSSLRGCFSAPISGSPTTVHWKSQPKVRGTFQLVVSCLVTSTLCAWMSLHLSISKCNESRVRRLFRKLGWALVAMLAPDLVVYMAFRQWCSAKVICNEVNSMLDVESSRDEECKSTQANNRWTMVHGYYASMGGFVLEIDPTVESFIPDTINRTSPFHLTVTARGVLLLAKCGHIPTISEELIIDRSKDSSLAKTVVCFQVAWMVTQVLARLAGRLPVTLLEINTLGHVLCSLTVYLCWWSKPLDISVPTVLSGKRIPQLCAYMWMSSQISGSMPAAHPLKPELRSLRYHPVEIITAADQGVTSVDTGSSSQGGLSSQGVPEKSARAVRLERGETLAGTGFELDPEPRYPNPPGYVDLRPVDVRRWRLASEALRQIPAVRANFERFSEEIRSAGDELLVKKTPNWPAWDLVELEKVAFGLDVALVLILVGVVYGGLFIAAWNVFFLTGIERWVWRVSSLYIICSGFILSTLIFVGCAIQDRGWGGLLFIQTFRDGFPVFAIILSLGYFVCRFILFVEGIVSIRELPSKAYETPGWTQLIPHF